MRLLKAVQLLIALSTLSVSAQSDPVYINEVGSDELVKEIQFRFSESRQNLQDSDIQPDDIEFIYQGEHGVQHVAVSQSIPIVVRDNVSNTEYRLYEATVNDQSAVITLENNNIQLSYSHFDGNNETLFYTNIEKTNITETTRTLDINKYQEPDSSYENPVNEVSPNIGSDTQTAINSLQHKTPQEFIVYLFINGSINGRDRVEMIHRYFGWWAKHMVEISAQSEKKTGSPLFTQITLEWVGNYPEGPYARGRYRHSYWFYSWNSHGRGQSYTIKSIFFNHVKSAIYNWHQAHKPKPTNARILYLLVGSDPVIGDDIEESCSGFCPTISVKHWWVADPKKELGLSTLLKDHYPAKTLGELMGAREDLARPGKRRLPFFKRSCSTINTRESSRYVSRCKYYSEENRNRIIDYFLRR